MAASRANPQTLAEAEFACVQRGQILHKVLAEGENGFFNANCYVSLNFMAKEQNNQTVRSLADLGQLFPEFELRVPRRMGYTDIERLEEFHGLSLAQKLQTAYGLKEDPKARGVGYINLKAAALCEALQADQGLRDDNNVRVIAFLPGEDLTALMASRMFTYPVYVIFPCMGSSRYLSTSRVAAAGYDEVRGGEEAVPTLEALQFTDALVKRCAEIREERSLHRCNRLVNQIKITDSLIKGEKRVADRQMGGIRDFKATRDFGRRNTTVALERLNQYKAGQIIEYLQYADTLVKEYPCLSPLYSLSRATAWDTLHLTLEMWLVSFQPFLRSLLDSSARVCVARSKDYMTTNLNKQELLNSRSRFLSGRVSIAFDVNNYNIAALLGV